MSRPVEDEEEQHVNPHVPGRTGKGRPVSVPAESNLPEGSGGQGPRKATGGLVWLTPRATGVVRSPRMGSGFKTEDGVETSFGEGGPSGGRTYEGTGTLRETGLCNPLVTHRQ